MPIKSLILKNFGSTDVVNIENIVFVSASGSYSEIILKDKSRIFYSKNLHWFEDKIKSDFFCRIHRSYLVNLIHVAKVLTYDHKIILTDGTCIPLARDKKKVFWNKMETIAEGCCS